MLKRWTRIALVVLGLVAVMVAAHRTADSSATRHLRDAIARLGAAVEVESVAALPAPPTPEVEELAQAMQALRKALGPDRRRLFFANDRESEPITIDELRAIVTDAAAELGRVDAALIAVHGTLPAIVEHDQLDDTRFLDVARLSEAEVRVHLDAKEYDAAGKAARRISSLPDLLENGLRRYPPRLRLKIARHATRVARSVLEQAPQPAVLPDLVPNSTDGTNHAAWIEEARGVHRALTTAYTDDLDLDALSTSDTNWTLAPTASLPYLRPWVKSGVAELTHYTLAVKDHLKPTPADVVRLRALAHDRGTDGNFLVQAFLPESHANSLQEELETSAGIDVLRAGSIALAHFREHGAWPAPESFGSDVVAVSEKKDLKLRSARAPNVTWRLVAPEPSVETDAR